MLRPLLVLRSGLLLQLLLIAAVVTTASAQWTRSLGPVLHPHAQVAGALSYHDGLLWAAYDEVWVSSDAGQTWSKRSGQFGQRGASYASAIAFVDRSVGYVSTMGTADGGVYKTTDGGISWLPLVYGQFQGLSCDPSGTTILVGEKSGKIYRSTNAGATWTKDPVYSTFVTDVHYDRGTWLALAGYDPTAVIVKSTDSGLTWQQSTTIDGDTWSFTANRCQPDALWAANEDAVANIDGRSEIFGSTDDGATWTRRIDPVPRLTGAITSGPRAITAGLAYQAGLLQSTDNGSTWQSIPGPHTTIDTRMILSLDDTLFIAADSDGYIWRGRLGFTGRQATLSTTSLFDHDTLLACDGSVTGRANFTTAECVSLADARLVTSDSGAYSVLHLPDTGATDDSLVVRYDGPDSGAAAGLILLTLTDSTRLEVQLGGYRRASILVAAASASATASAIGDIVEIPLHLTATAPIDHAAWRLRYDSATFVYRGSYLADGTPLQTSIPPNTGDIAVVADVPPVTAIDAVARLQCFPTTESTAAYPITIDSIAWSSAKSCRGILAAGTSATVTAPADCTTPILSEFLRYATTPKFEVTPNPATSEVNILVDGLADYTISVVDMIGATRISEHFDRPGAHRIGLDKLPSGAYVITAASTRGWKRSRQILIQRP